MEIVLACADLMTASRLESSRHAVKTCRREQQVVAEVEAGVSTVVLDLTAFDGLGEQLRERGGELLVLIAFAPHVQVERLEAAGAWADRVLPRGAIVKRFDAIIDEVTAG